MKCHGKNRGAAEGEEELHLCVCPPCHTHHLSSLMFLNLCCGSFHFTVLVCQHESSVVIKDKTFRKQFTAIYCIDLWKSVVYCLQLFELLLRLPKLEIRTISD